jgi:acyl-CoA reductase-like NAD-dependent aldehyde dehydrogenase
MMKGDIHTMRIGGRWVTAERSIPVTDPYSGEVIGEIPHAGPGQVDEALDSAVRGARQMAALTAAERSRILLRTAEGIREGGEQLARILSREVGKTIREARGEVNRTIQTFTVAAEEAKRIHGQGVPMDADPRGSGRLGFTMRVPVGVVLAVTPFNFPLNLAAHKLAPALAAGNSVALKPATETPLADLRLAAILEQSGLPDEALNVITGPGGEIGPQLTSDERVRMLSFTGSLAVGRTLMAAPVIRKSTMELGSNSAVIVMADADADLAAGRIVAGAFALAGQVCISVQRVYVQRPLFDRLTKLISEGAGRLIVGDPREEDTDMGPMISESAADRAQSWIDEALQAGAKRPAGGRREGALLWPTVLTQVPDDCRICSEEAFAPVVVVNPVDTLDEAIARVNDSQYGLQAGIFTGDLDAALRAAREIEVGGVMINEVPTFRVDHMPYGGMKMSGIGREGLRYAIEEMTEIRLICFRT